MASRIRQVLLLAGVIVGLLTVATPVSATPFDPCRAVARSVNHDVLALGNGPGTDADKHARAWTLLQEGAQNRPECRADLQQLITYYNSGGSLPFPFPASKDPTKPFLGPVGWWWNVIFVSLCARSVSSMVWYGFWLFALPFVLALSLLWGGVSALVGRIHQSAT